DDLLDLAGRAPRVDDDDVRRRRIRLDGGLGRRRIRYLDAGELALEQGSNALADDRMVVDDQAAKRCLGCACHRRFGAYSKKGGVTKPGGAAGHRSATCRSLRGSVRSPPVG